MRGPHSSVAAPAAAARFTGVDGLRGLAALAILATHTGFAAGRSLRNDLPAALLGRFDFGVAVFFVISGFVLYRPAVARSFGGEAEPSLWSFWRRRLVRILPALWLMVSVTLVVLDPHRARLSDWLHYLLLIQVYDHSETNPNFSQLWTLSAEVAFYAMLPVLARLVRWRARTPVRLLCRQLIAIGALLVVAVAANLLQAHLLRDTQAVLWVPCYLDWFAIGLLAAVLSATPAAVLADIAPVARLQRTVAEWARAPLTCWAAAALLWLISTTQVGTPRTVVLPTFWQWTVQHYLFAAAAALLLVPLVVHADGRTARALGGRVGSVLGQLSYGIYLWHLPLLLFLQRQLGYAAFRGHFGALLVVTTLCTLPVAALSWFCLERPLLRYEARRRRRRRRRRQPGSPASTVSTTAEMLNS
jgi:peptidoglycan/LPS O-acetylase OafA/YrhL